ncbi:MAG TPA: hypothetical protein VLU24_12400 [Mycobacterium sp.]|nr:hypothetical protein [Mycobacterium sp.]
MTPECRLLFERRDGPIPSYPLRPIPWDSLSDTSSEPTTPAVTTMAAPQSAMIARIAIGSVLQHIPARHLVTINDGYPDVRLYSQCRKLDSTLVARITDAVCSAAELRGRRK